MSDEELRTQGSRVPHPDGYRIGRHHVQPARSHEAELNLNGPVIADIFMGKVTKWNAPEIAGLNKGVALPNKDILVVHRTDGSGTTYIFSDYLSNVSAPWKTGPGNGKEVKWPVGLGGKGNDGVTGQVKQTPGCDRLRRARVRAPEQASVRGDQEQAG